MVSKVILMALLLLAPTPGCRCRPALPNHEDGLHDVYDLRETGEALPLTVWDRPPTRLATGDPEHPRTFCIESAGRPPLRPRSSSISLENPAGSTSWSGLSEPAFARGAGHARNDNLGLRHHPAGAA